VSKKDRLTYLKHYNRDHFLRITLTLGGICMGTVSLGGRDEIEIWKVEKNLKQVGKEITIQ